MSDFSTKFRFDMSKNLVRIENKTKTVCLFSQQRYFDNDNFESKLYEFGNIYLKYYSIEFSKTASHSEFWQKIIVGFGYGFSLCML